MPAGWVEAAGAAVSAGESIANNVSAQGTSKANNASVAQTQAAQGSMLTQAEQVAQQPFTPYTGTLTAPLAGNQQQAISQASKVANDGTAQADNAAATGLVGQVANNGWNANTASTYMNPYTQAVTNASLTAENKSYLQNLAGIQTGAAGSGAFGGSREAIQEGELGAQHNLNQGTLTATGNANAYNSAVQTWQADNNTKLAAAAAYEAAGQDVTAMNSSQISDLLKTGGVSQVIAQTDLNNQYGQFMRQQGWSAQQLGPLISAVGTAKGGTQQSAPVQSNTANQLLGLGSTVAGLFGSGGADTPTVGNSAPPPALTNSIGTNVGGLNNFTATPSINGGGLGSGGGGVYGSTY